MRDAKKYDVQDSSGCGTATRRMAGMIRRVRDDAGQAFVELALIMPVFTLLILGAAEFGQVLYAAIEVSNAARAGVQYGAQSAATAADTAGITAAAVNDAANLTGALGTSTLNVVPTQFCTCSGDATSTPVTCSTASATCSANGAHAINYVEVQTSATVTPLAHYPGITGGFTLNGQAIMRVE